MSAPSWMRGVGVAAGVGCVLASLVAGSAATAIVAAAATPTPMAWGSNGYGRLGNGTTTDSSIPVQLSSLSGVTAVAGGGEHSLALKSDGTVWAWGHNNYGQLGSGTTTDSSTPVQVSSLSGVTAIAGGDKHSLALKSDGTVWAWGYNAYGQLGNGTTTNSSTPVQVSGLAGATAIAGGLNHSLALKSDGTVRAWGNNLSGQLGIGTLISSSTPVQAGSLTGVTAIAAGNHSLALKSDGTLWAWGFNGYGQLGNGTTTNNMSPVQVPGLIGVSAIAGGYNHSLAAKSDGTAWAWGDDNNGQLGNGLTTGPDCGGYCWTSPVQVTGLSGVTAVAGGHFHSLALKSGGTVWAWGDNSSGQLGNPGACKGTTSSSTPLQVLNLTGATAIAGGASHNLALGAPLATPVVSGVTPCGGPAAGGTPVTITGIGFTGASSVHFGANASTALNVLNDTTIGATSPAGTAGTTVDVTVTTPSGASAIIPADRYAYTDLHTVVSTQQYTLTGSDGTAWTAIDGTNLASTVAPAVNSTAILSGNVDLFTNTTGYNQDIGIFVSDNGGADTLVAWKESGGFAGTYSPNAAFVQGVYAMTAGHIYIFKLKWKTNKPEGGVIIYAGAGGGAPFSPTRLTAQVLPAGPNLYSAVSTQQFTLTGSDGTAWSPMDVISLAVNMAPAINSTAILGGNIDLFTDTTGYNQDVGIFVSDNGGADTLVAWKESGGFAGTYSPNAAFIQAVYQMTAGHSYHFSLWWKTNKPEGSATIFAAAGGGAPFSPTRLTAEVLPAGPNPYTAVSTQQYTLTNSDGTAWTTIDGTNLATSVAPTVNSTAILSANLDLFTDTSGYNQDIGIFVSDGGGPDTLVAWKESGGFAGTYSPNAAFVQGVYAMTASHSYVFKLKWKTNKPEGGAIIYAGAGGGAPFSPTRLTTEVS